MLIFLTKYIDRFKILTYNKNVVKICNRLRGEKMFNIKELRKKRGITQKQLANKLGIERSRVSQWEIGYCSPKASDLPKLAKALNCRINDFFKNKC
nr:helix-turn-helix transcriptional regulator [Megamonas funiformis]